jgi:uncharacterized protein YbcV (DUF1398 family)
VTAARLVTLKQRRGRLKGFASFVIILVRRHIKITNLLEVSEMNANEIAVLARATLDGSIPFSEIVGKLIANGVEYYHVDYASASFTFYSTLGAAVVAPITFEKLPLISEDFDATALKAAILDSQQHGQKFRAFCERAIRAGVQGYIVYLRGKRVTYFGRQGDQHTEWFPGARPNDA